MAITRTEFDALKKRVTTLEGSDISINNTINNLRTVDIGLDTRLKKLEGAVTPTPTPLPTNVLFSEDFSGFGDYSVPEGGLTKDGKMKNIWGIINIMHDAGGYFARVESRYTGDGNGISALLQTVQNFSNCRIQYKVRTNRFTWTNPKNYHGAWFMQRRSDSNHHYYEYIQRDGDLEAGKKDNLTTDTFSERQIIFSPQPQFEPPAIGKWYTYEWSTKNNPDGSISHIINGDNGTGMREIFNYIDSGVGSTDLYHHAITQQLLSGGGSGPYVEDAQCDYKDIIIYSYP